MSTGKYSPLCPNTHEDYTFFKFNCYGEVPESWNQEVHDSGVEYNSVTMFDDYDDEGFDSYGYSAFDADGNFVGHGSGIDRYGYTEMDYLTDSASGGNLYYDIQGWGGTRLTSFIRKR
jgi:hypothetical protein